MLIGITPLTSMETCWFISAEDLHRYLGPQLYSWSGQLLRQTPRLRLQRRFLAQVQCCTNAVVLFPLLELVYDTASSEQLYMTLHHMLPLLTQDISAWYGNVPCRHKMRDSDMLVLCVI